MHYNPRLVGLVKEVNQLSMLGHKIHPDIIKTAKLAQKFMKQAKALEEVSVLFSSNDGFNALLNLNLVTFVIAFHHSLGQMAFISILRNWIFCNNDHSFSHCPCTDLNVDFRYSGTRSHYLNT